MTKTEIRNQQRQLFGHKSLLDICLHLRTTVNGSTYPWCDNKVNQTIDFLRNVLATWEECSPDYPREAFDTAVKNLIEATLTEVLPYLTKEN